MGPFPSVFATHRRHLSLPCRRRGVTLLNTVLHARHWLWFPSVPCFSETVFVVSARTSFSVPLLPLCVVALAVQFSFLRIFAWFQSRLFEDVRFGATPSDFINAFIFLSLQVFLALCSRRNGKYKAHFGVSNPTVRHAPRRTSSNGSRSTNLTSSNGLPETPADAAYNLWDDYSDEQIFQQPLPIPQADFPAATMAPPLGVPCGDGLAHLCDVHQAFAIYRCTASGEHVTTTSSIHQHVEAKRSWHPASTLSGSVSV